MEKGMLSSNYDMEVPEMAKTSMFGGHLANNAETSQSIDHPRQSTNYMNSNNHNNSHHLDTRVESCFSVAGSSVCPSPSPTNKATRGLADGT